MIMNCLSGRQIPIELLLIYARGFDWPVKYLADVNIAELFPMLGNIDCLVQGQWSARGRGLVVPYQVVC